MKVRPDIKFPTTLFVEEGKHATAPDRNADGAFMRGYDVTERVNDAWGVRDSLGQGVLLSSGYASEMTKLRTAAYRLMPPHSALVQVTLPTQYEAGSNNRTLSELSLPDSWLSASFRVAGRTLGAALIFKGLDLREGWIVPRVTVSEQDATGELLFTPSASRWADYYLSGGARRQFVTTREQRTIDTEQGRQEVEVVIPPDWKIAVETGVKIRARIPRRCGPSCLGTHSAACGSACRHWDSAASISFGSSGRSARARGETAECY